MPLELEVLLPAQMDVSNAQDWYEDATPGLGEAFSEEFLTALALLADMPGIGSRRFAHLYARIDLRCWSLDRFPFRIFYAVQGNTLRVYRVYHERRNVKKSLLRRTR
jgi:toxin ParE1/3/4